MTGIYLITNLTNHKLYVGKSVNIEQRWGVHRIAQNKNMPIHHAIRKYGVDNFKFEVLIECPIESLDFFETSFIQGYGASHLLYNIQTGGQGGWGHIDNCGSKRSEESKQKMREAALKRPKRIHSEETKAKMRESAHAGWQKRRMNAGS